MILICIHGIATTHEMYYMDEILLIYHKLQLFTWMKLDSLDGTRHVCMKALGVNNHEK
jgi:hypothetical protein